MKHTELPIMLEVATSLRNKTGGWRSFRPEIDEKKCTGCLICWIFCPDGCVKKEKIGKRYSVKIEYDYCKGCGICAAECPAKAIAMRREG